MAGDRNESSVLSRRQFLLAGGLAAGGLLASTLRLRAGGPVPPGPVVEGYVLSLRGRRRRPQAALRHNHFHLFASPQAADAHRAYLADRSRIVGVPLSRTTYELLFVRRGTAIADLRNLALIEPFPLPGETTAFKRGDTDGDGTVSINDPIRSLNHLFLGAEAPRCPDAADSDDDGEVGITDPIHTLSWLFLGGRAPPFPGPRRCGPDLTPGKKLGACRYDPAACE